jgi:hypothetical protein
MSNEEKNINPDTEIGLMNQIKIKSAELSNLCGLVSHRKCSSEAAKWTLRAQENIEIAVAFTEKANSIIGPLGL